jgi:hypothetical protein
MKTLFKNGAKVLFVVSLILIPLAAYPLGRGGIGIEDEIGDICLPTFCMMGDDCDGCFLNCQLAWDNCKEGCTTRACESQCGAAEWDCLTQAREVCQ